MTSEFARRAAAAVCAAALLGACAAQAGAQSTAEERQYVVLEEDATITLPSRISGYQVEGRSLLIKVGGNEWYRAEIDRACAVDLRGSTAVPLVEPAGSPIDQTSFVVVDGRRCHFQSLDRIADPEAQMASAH